MKSNLLQNRPYKSNWRCCKHPFKEELFLEEAYQEENDFLYEFLENKDKVYYWSIYFILKTWMTEWFNRSET